MPNSMLIRVSLALAALAPPLLSGCDVLPTFAIGENGGTDLGENAPADGAVTGAPTAGADLFAENCALCHGQDGTGTLVGADLTDETAAEISEEFRRSVTHSLFFDLTEQDIADIAAFLRG